MRAVKHDRLIPGIDRGFAAVNHGAMVQMIEKVSVGLCILYFSKASADIHAKGIDGVFRCGRINRSVQLLRGFCNGKKLPYVRIVECRDGISALLRFPQHISISITHV
ncbi:Uncharacterised protein [uncultured Blautia sp.]|nr:Uncharacterised protein [uncultured Blautia sp.]